MGVLPLASPPFFLEQTRDLELIRSVYLIFQAKQEKKRFFSLMKTVGKIFGNEYLHEFTKYSLKDTLSDVCFQQR